jgi:aminoglycoside 6-adenylyltransferase
MASETPVIERLTRWAEAQPDIHAMLLTSSRANVVERVDKLSDYDVILAVGSPAEWAADDSWQEDFGPPLVRFRDQNTEMGVETYCRLVIYEDGTKIDYSIWPIELLAKIDMRRKLPEALDVGYCILVDKDGQADTLPLASYRAHIPAKPDAAEYQALVEEFWWESSYVAKNLWRDELMFARYSLDRVMKTDLLRRMLEWRVEIEYDWSLRPGVLGRGLKKLLPTETWAAFERTYAGPDIEENWRALFDTLDLFRRTAIEVGDALGYAYPHDLDRKMMIYLEGIRKMERESAPVGKIDDAQPHPAWSPMEDGSRFSLSDAGI